MTRKRETLVSTDILGVLGRPEHLGMIYGPFFWDGTIKGVELIGWRGFRQTRLGLNMLGFSVESVHGPVGGLGDGKGLADIAKVVAFQGLMVPLSGVLPLLAEGVDVVIHSPVLKDERLIPVVATRWKNATGRLLIENNRDGQRVLDHAIDVVEMLRSGGMVNSGLIFDLGHYIPLNSGRNFHTKVLATNWNNILNALRDTAGRKDDSGQSILFGVHVPVGSGDDALTDGILTDHTMLSELAEVLDQTEVNRQVIEYPHASIARCIIPDSKTLAEERRRTGIIFEAFKKSGVI